MGGLLLIWHRRSLVKSSRKTKSGEHAREATIFW